MDVNLNFLTVILVGLVMFEFGRVHENNLNFGGYCIFGPIVKFNVKIGGVLEVYLNFDGYYILILMFLSIF
jgi:hypothetical protein